MGSLCFPQGQGQFQSCFHIKTVCISSAKSSPSTVRRRRQRHTYEDSQADVCMHTCTSKCTHTGDACICTYNTCSHANMGAWKYAHLATGYLGFLKDLSSWWDHLLWGFVLFCFVSSCLRTDWILLPQYSDPAQC